MLGFIQNLIPTILVLGVLIFIHELGHFMVAVCSGVTVEKFSLGFGPELFRIKHKKTVYALSLIPFGGFVKMAGETFEDREGEAIQPTDFLAQNPWKRFLIIFAGPLMNYFLAFVFLTIVFVLGKPTMSPVVGELLEDYPAQAAGLKVNDKVVAIDERSITTWEELNAVIQDSKEKAVTLLIERDKARLSLSIEPRIVESQSIFGDPIKVKKIGIYPSEEMIRIRYDVITALGMSAETVWKFTSLTYQAIARLVTGRLAAKAISGPLGIMVITSRTAKLGFVYLLQLTAILSISLAIFNLLPIPALDGGHLFFLIIEAIRRKPVSFKLQERFAQVGFTLLMILMVFVIYNDAINFELWDKVKNVIPFFK